MTLDRTKLQSGNPLKIIPEFLRLLRSLRAGKFSLVVDFQGYGETAWLTWFTGAPQRWGSVYSKGRAWAYTRGIRRPGGLHLADWNLSLLRQCGLKIGRIQNEFILPQNALDAAKSFLSGEKLEVVKPTLFIQPFTSSPQKNWPLENYLAVARHWRARGAQVVWGGGPGDGAVLEPARREGFTVSAGVPLLVTGGLMQLSTLVLGGDTGALHLAVALGKRVLMLMHEASPGSPVPFQHPEWVVEAPRPEAIGEISVAEVNAAVARGLNAPTDNVSC
jgi:ADP-heptose:LPS heptosyltransferase